MGWEPEVITGAEREWPDAIVAVRNSTGERRRYVPERTCEVVREHVDLDGECMTDYSCCFNQPGWGHNFCPNCGAKVVE